MDRGLIADTPEAIRLYGLIVLKGDLRLLKHGIKRSRYNARTLARQQFPEMRTMDLDKLIARVEEEIATLGENPESRFKPL